MVKPRGMNPEFLAHVGKGRKKGVPNKTTPVKKVATQLVQGLIMEQTELLARLTRHGRADIGKHLKFSEDGKLLGVEVDPQYTEIIRDLELKEGPRDEKTGKPLWTETKVRVADPMPALGQLAKYHGLEKAAQGQLSATVWLAIFQRAGLTGERLRAAALATLEVEE